MSNSDFSWVKAGEKAEGVDVEDVWNQCTILRVAKDRKKALVHYDGWPSSYDEEIDVIPGKIDVLGKHTIRRRCWVKVKEVHYPSIALLRSGATQRGVQYLKNEKLLGVYILFPNQPEFKFVKPNLCTSWQRTPKKIVDSGLKKKDRSVEIQPDDELPLRFLEGTFPADDRLQLPLSKQSLEVEEEVAVPDIDSFPEGFLESVEKASQQPEQSIEKEEEEEEEELPSSASHLLFQNHILQTMNTKDPSARLLDLVRQIELSITQDNKDEFKRNVKRTMPTTTTSSSSTNADESESSEQQDIWGKGSSTAPEDFAIRSYTTDKFKNM